MQRQGTFSRRTTRRKRWGIVGSAPLLAAASWLSLLLLTMSMATGGQAFRLTAATVRPSSRSSNRLSEGGAIAFPASLMAKVRANGRQGYSWWTRQLAAASSSSSSSSSSLPSLEDYPAQEVQEMEDLILSLSREDTDASRRGRVEALFRDAALVAPSSSPADDNEGGAQPNRFSPALFNLVLISVGNRVQEEAQQRMLQEPSLPSDDVSMNTAPEAPATSAESSSSSLAGNFQLWALVDMMVQSKTIVKRARGELGKDGTFG